MAAPAGTGAEQDAVATRAGSIWGPASFPASGAVPPLDELELDDEEPDDDEPPELLDVPESSPPVRVADPPQAANETATVAVTAGTTRNRRTKGLTKAES